MERLYASARRSRRLAGRPAVFGRWRLRAPLGSFDDVPIQVQVITISKAEFEETRDVIGGIAYPAAKYGKVIYA